MKQRHRVLVVEDEPKIARLLQDYLQNEGFEASTVGNGEHAVAQVRKSPPDLIILDLMLPGLDGISVCRAIRQFSDVPILMLTARIDEIDRLLGLDTGADDYVCKPFSPREVMARVRALLRRAKTFPGNVDMPWHLDETRLQIAWRGHWLPLTLVEFRILRKLLSQPGRVFSRAQLLDVIHDDLRDISDRAIDSHIKNLRRKILVAEPDCDPIAAVYGLGYRLELP